MKSDDSFKVSVCIPSSVIRQANARNTDQATYIAHQIARIAAEYHVQELVVLDIPEDGDTCTESHSSDTVSGKKVFADQEDIKPENQLTRKSIYLALLLQFFVTPPYLFKSVFKSKKDRKTLRCAQKLPKLTALPFTRDDTSSKGFREGLTISKKSPKRARNSGKKSPKLSVTKYVNVGLTKPLELAGQEVPINSRVTVDLKEKRVVSPMTAYEFSGLKGSFGYYVRCASALSNVFTDLVLTDGYTGTIFVDTENYYNKPKTLSKKEFKPSKDGNYLLLIGNFNHFEKALKLDKQINSVVDIIDSTLDGCSGLRTEDALLISLSQMKSLL